MNIGTKKALVIGGGFYGLYIAEYLALNNYQVILFERNSDLMQRASFNNQARIHNGYHYPRSTITALRSRVSFPHFIEEFKDAIYSDFKKYYLIGKPLGKISAPQFEQFCKRIKAPLKEADASIMGLVNHKYIDGIYEANELAFDAVKLKEIMLQRALNAGVKIKTNTNVSKIKKHKSQELTVYTDNDGKEKEYVASQVFNCTYSGINIVNSNSGFDIIPLRHELTEMCLMELPDELQGLSFTVMCGPFFSIMPFPSTTYSSLSHVRYTPHFDWVDSTEKLINSYNLLTSASQKTNWNKMLYDAKRYIPLLEKCEYKKSIWEAKTILPTSDFDDSRPILFKENHGIEGYHCIMGGKIDNVYDVIRSLTL